ncbi:G patch domain-containing protein 4 isoform X1 [Hemitrygon akajei]|uniref:G patch domain-containing protein 4 isoform X1 n=1 Tax=Hemitrygon akajei TaxID=2704970 RepID=UPI003BF961C3
MEFAERHMRERGWSRGKGLGQREDGISEPIKVKVKCDTAGIGHRMGEQFTFHWWDHVFNKAAANIVVETVEDGVEVRKARNTEQEQGPISNKKPRKAQQCRDLLYGRFVKAATLTPDKQQQEVPPSPEGSDSDSTSDEDEKLNLSSTTRLTNEELVQVCGGRTAHKGARHGVTMNAKLLRLEEQEKEFMAKYGRQQRVAGIVATEDGVDRVEEEERRKRKKKKRTSPAKDVGAEGWLKSEEGVETEGTGPSSQAADELIPRRKAKRHKRRRGAKGGLQSESNLECRDTGDGRT